MAANVEEPAAQAQQDISGAATTTEAAIAGAGFTPSTPEMRPQQALIGTPQSVRTNAETIEAVMPSTALPVAAANDLIAAIDFMVGHSMAEGALTEGEMLYVLRQYTQAFETGMPFGQ